MKIIIASDHAGYELKKEVINQIQDSTIEWVDVGTDSMSSCDYPDYVHKLAKELSEDKQAIGILICGSGIGVSITANRYNHIRAALAWTEEIAVLSRQHNNANVLCLPARFISIDLAINTIRAFLSTDFEGGRHQARVDKINNKSC